MIEVTPKNYNTIDGYGGFMYNTIRNEIPVFLPEFLDRYGNVDNEVV